MATIKTFYSKCAECGQKFAGFTQNQADSQMRTHQVNRHNQPIKGIQNASS